MISIGAGGGSRGRSLERRSPAGQLAIVCTEVTAATGRVCMERASLREQACARVAVGPENGATSNLPPRQITRHTMSSKVCSSLLKTNDGCTRQMTHKTRGVRPACPDEGRGCFRGTTAEFPDRAPSLDFKLPGSPFHFPLAIPESRRSRPASDSLSGGTI
jgi:hypothetical protein